MALEILSGLLVVITAYYAVQTYQMVQEMRAARAAQLLPRLALSVDLFGPGLGMLRLTNAGPGSALSVDIELLVGPSGPTRRWVQPVIAPNETHDFLPDPTQGAPNGRARLDDFVSVYSTASIRGTCYDVLGGRHSIESEVDVKEFWEVTKLSQRAVPPNYPRDMAKRLEGIEKELRWIKTFIRPVSAPPASGPSDPR